MDFLQIKRHLLRVAVLTCLVVLVNTQVPAYTAQKLQLIDQSQQYRYDAPDDCKYTYFRNQDISLACTLRTINSDFDTTNFSVIPAEHTKSLNIQCNSDLRAKSKLEPKSFSHLTLLNNLAIEYCKFGKLHSEIFYGLNELKNLSIKTHNIHWAALNLEVEANTFQHLKNLEKLDLSTNNIWSLPESLFCQLNGLRFLNVSENRLQDINDLGFRERVGNEYGNKNGTILLSTLMTPTTTTIHLKNTCMLDLEILDISFNHFVLLPGHGFGTLKRLKRLNINNNEVSMLSDYALSGLRYLQIVDLSSNKIVALPSELFKDQAQSIVEIYLQNNSISVLSPGLFSNLVQLQALDVSSNQLSSSWINQNTFKGLIRLVLLNLSKNKITKLESEIFSNLFQLQILNLRYNKLESIDADTFSLMSNLHTLLLSHNKIKYLDAYSLNGLGVLSLLSIDNNALTGIHPEAFRNCTSLQDLNLNGNELAKVPLALMDMRLLRTVDLGENLITVLEEPGFRGMNNLYGMRLIGNRIENISRNSFRELPNLQILNMAKNQISYIEKGSFEASPSVQAIRLDGNMLTQVDGLFANMPNLLWLNVSDNRLEHFDLTQIPVNLQWLDIHRNELTELENEFSLDVEYKLQTLDVSFNRLEKVTPYSFPNSVELVFLNDNLIQEVEAHTFLHKYNLTRVDLYANRITSLDIKSLRLMPFHEDKPLPEFYIGGNPFICDCNIEWLKNINELKQRQYPKIMDIDTIYCKLLYNRDKQYVELIEAEPHHFLCSYNLHCFALCDCCEKENCECEMTCPNNCTCFHDQTWNTNIVECSASTYKDVPKNLPIDITELYLDGTDLLEMATNSFLGKNKLKVLYLNNSNIHSIQNGTFHTLQKLLILHLENNKLQKLIGHEFNGLENLRELYLQHNKLQHIDIRSFQALKKMEVIRLDGNLLINFEIWHLAYNPYLVEIALSDNNWSCDCHYLNKLQIYLQSNTEKIVDLHKMACVYNNFTNILKEKNGTICTLKDGMSSIVYAKQIEDLLPFLLIATCAFVCFFALTFGIFCYRSELKMFFKTRCLPLFGCCGYKSGDFLHDHNDTDKLYDAYVIYSLQDEHFVGQVLANSLENDIGYRLCMHYRDFNLNVNNYIADTIVEAIDNSKRALLVLSKNFLYNEWSRFEFKGAVHEILKRRRKLIIVLYGDIPQKDLDADIRLYLKTNTCIEWDDKKFWQKLRLALPSTGLGKVSNKHCLAKRSTINIYATAQHPQQLQQSQFNHRPPHDYNTMGPRNTTSMRRIHNGHNIGPAAIRLDNYAVSTMNNCPPKNCDNYEAINNCKFSTMQTATEHQLNNVNLNRGHKQHDYAVPINNVTSNECNNTKYTSSSTSSLSNGSSDFCTRSLSSPSNNHCIDGLSNDNLNADGVFNNNLAAINNFNNCKTMPSSYYCATNAAGNTATACNTTSKVLNNKSDKMNIVDENNLKNTNTEKKRRLPQDLQMWA